MDTFATYIDGLIFFCAGMAVFLAISLPLVALTDWLQKKLDEINNEVDEQLNEQEQ